MSKLLAFHGDPAIKEKYLARIKDHEAEDEIIHGIYWKNGKGCAVGCTIHSNLHKNYEKELGIPQALAHLEDTIFEGMSNGDSKLFPRRFLSSIPVGADLSLVVPKFLLWLLMDKTHGVIRWANEDTVPCIQVVSKLLRREIRGGIVTTREWAAAVRAAVRAAWAEEARAVVGAAWAEEARAVVGAAAAAWAVRAAWAEEARAAAWAAEEARAVVGAENSHAQANKLIYLLKRA